MKFVFAILALLTVSEAFAGMTPVKMLCGAYDGSNKPYVVIDFETSSPSKDLGRVGQALPKTYTTADFPFPQYRPITTGKERFRVASHIMTTPYKAGQYIAYLTIFEEDPDGKTLHRRASHVVDIKELQPAYQIKYSVPGTQRSVSCYAHLAAPKGVAGKPAAVAKPARRVPAKSPR
jgi:hypothetical protein